MNPPQTIMNTYDNPIEFKVNPDIEVLILDLLRKNTKV